MNEQVDRTPSVNRRELLSGTAAAGALALAGIARAEDPSQAARGNVNQSIVHWCFQEYWDVEKACEVANQLGCKSVELVASEHFPTLKKQGLMCALGMGPLFVQGMNNPRYQEPVTVGIKKSIDACAAAGFPSVIAFTGYAQESGEWADGGIPDVDNLPADRPTIEPDEGLRNCVAGFKEVARYAEQNGVNVSLEMLNTRDDTHPMKGHPGYQGDHVDYCMEIINQVGSPRFGLLFDIYHVQIMDGDVIRRIHQCGEAINHVHTAGNPGRCELDDTQEINYPPCLQALVEIGYEGYVGHEFIPTRDPFHGLAEAVQLCDV